MAELRCTLHDDRHARASRVTCHQLSLSHTLVTKLTPSPIPILKTFNFSSQLLDRVSFILRPRQKMFDLYSRSLRHHPLVLGVLLDGGAGGAHAPEGDLVHEGLLGGGGGRGGGRAPGAGREDWTRLLLNKDGSTAGGGGGGWWRLCVDGNV